MVAPIVLATLIVAGATPEVVGANRAAPVADDDPLDDGDATSFDADDSSSD